MKKERTFWNKLRILVTNRCNYSCSYCHNEGQEKNVKANDMKLNDLIRIVDYINGQDISEIHFSGGEPFLNKEIVEMIEYVDKTTNWGIGCATNLSKITKEQIFRLAKTRVKFNIQFPYANSKMFHYSTGNSNYNYILEQIYNVKRAGIRIGLNTVVQSNDLQNIKNIIDFAIEHQLSVKFLPELGLIGSDKFKETIYPLLKDLSCDVTDKGTGALRWIIEKDGKRIVVLYIDSPCFNNDISECREFGELRIHPDMSLQPCIFKEPKLKLNLEEGKDKITEKLIYLWNDFKHC